MTNFRYSDRQIVCVWVVSVLCKANINRGPNLGIYHLALCWKTNLRARATSPLIARSQGWRLSSGEQWSHGVPPHPQGRKLPHPFIQTCSVDPCTFLLLVLSGGNISSSLQEPSEFWLHSKPVFHGARWSCKAPPLQWSPHGNHVLAPAHCWLL